MPIRVVVVDDSKIDRIRLVQLLTHFDKVELIAQEGNPETAIGIILKHKPDLVFLDIEMPKLTGFDIADAISKGSVKPTVVFVTAYEQYAIKAIRNRAFDYLLKPLSIDNLSKMLERYEDDMGSSKNNPDHIIDDKLTQREAEVLSLLIQGKTSKDISNQLNISINTVNSHRASLLKKTKSKNTAELILWSATRSFD